MRTQVPIVSMRATKKATKLVLAVVRYGDIAVRGPAHELAHRLAHRFGYLLETYISDDQVDLDADVPVPLRVLHRDRARTPPRAPFVPYRIRLLRSVEPAWALALAHYLETVKCE